MYEPRRRVNWFVFQRVRWARKKWVIKTKWFTLLYVWFTFGADLDGGSLRLAYDSCARSLRCGQVEVAGHLQYGWNGTNGAQIARGAMFALV